MYVSKHDYLILEPDTATNTRTFHVVEDELDETTEQKDGECSNEYFILEKTFSLLSLGSTVNCQFLVLRVLNTGLYDSSTSRDWKLREIYLYGLT